MQCALHMHTQCCTWLKCLYAEFVSFENGGENKTSGPFFYWGHNKSNTSMVQKRFGFLVLLTWASSGCLSSTFILLSAELKQVEEGVGVTREAKDRELFVQPLKHFDCSLGFFKAAHVEQYLPINTAQWVRNLSASCWGLEEKRHQMSSFFTCGSCPSLGYLPLT